MPLPSYAQATASSARKANQPPNPPKATQPAPKATPPTKKLKRPSTLTPKHRQTIAYNSTLSPINPQDPTKPCPLSTLPSELRTQIYHHVFQSTKHIPQPHPIAHKTTRCIRYVWPHLLHISHAIRIEAAYTYYTTWPFTFPVCNLDFSSIRTWLAALPPAHRALLARNRHMSIRVAPQLRLHYSYPPKGWLLDDTLQSIWRACASVGNFYAVPATYEYRVHFLFYCRLVAWFRWNALAPFRDICWRYEFCTVGLTRGWEKSVPEEVLLGFLKDKVNVLRRDWGKAVVRGGVDGKGVDEAVEFLEQLNAKFEMFREGSCKGTRDAWDNEMTLLRRAVERWQSS